MNPIVGASNPQVPGSSPGGGTSSTTVVISTIVWLELDRRHQVSDGDAERRRNQGQLAGEERPLAAHLVGKRRLRDAEGLLSELGLLNPPAPKRLVNGFTQQLIERAWLFYSNHSDICGHKQHFTT